MPAKTEHYRFMPWEIEDVEGVTRQLLSGYADVTRGGGLKYDQVTFLGPGGMVRAEMVIAQANEPGVNRYEGRRGCAVVRRG
jgi:hypothetical protein